MQRRTFLGVAGGAVLGAGAGCLFAAKKPTKKGDPKSKVEKAPTAEVDVTKQVRQYNSDKYASPPSQFRRGHVKPRKLPEKTLKRTSSGFSIQLPSKAPVPTPAVYKDKIYVSGGFHSKEFYCFHAATGKQLWGFNLDDDGPSSPAVDDGVCIYNTESCTIFAHDADTGKLIWSLWLGDPLMSSPTIANGKVFTSYPASGRGGKKAPPQSHVLICLELKTGKILWQKWIDSDVMSAPVAVDGDLHVATFAGTLYKFKQADGAIVSAKKSRATSSPIVVGKDVFYTKRTDNDKQGAQEGIANQDRDTGRLKQVVEARKAPNVDATVQKKAKLAVNGEKLDAGNGFAGGAPAQANPGLALMNVGLGHVSTLQAYQGARVMNWGGRNYACPGGDQLVCTQAGTGKALWKFKLEGDLKKEGGSLAAPPVAAGGQVFLSTLNGEVLQLDPKNGKLVRRYKIGSPTRFQPAVVKGRIYVGTQDGRLVCIDTGNKTYTGWSMWGANAARTGVVEGLAKK